ncbi:MAG TPA: Ig-like domain-containing protein [Thermomicrobiales bacterium]|nr:Ig-like domain-containing protein [Thermomicrobiales bacterium]
MADHNCREAREIISAFIDGEASREESARLRQHLASCADCREVLDSYRQIGGAIRGMPAVHPPYHLTESIFAQTIDAEPRRLFLITSRLGYSLAAIAAILLIFVVAGYLIIGGYERGVQPTVASSEPKSSPTGADTLIWPLQDPIRIEFNKEMNHESVIAALGMQPQAEKDQLSRSWDGNTLVIGGNPPFKPNTHYEIKISTDALDKWGNPLKEPFRLAFTTSSSQTMVQTPTPVILPSATPESALPTSTTGVIPPASTPTPDGSAPETATTPPGNNPAPGSGNGTAVVPTNPNPPLDPTETATPPRPTPTDAPVEPTTADEPTATLTPPPTATAVPPTATPTPLPPTATATIPAPTATETPDTIPVVGAIGDVYWRDQTVQDRLGKAVAPATSFVTDQLDFQRGVMMLDETRANIYVLKFGSGWDTWGVPTGEMPSAEPGPEQDIYVPGLTFGLLWRSNVDLQDDLGFALSEFAISFSADVQIFENGRIISTPTTVYVIYDDTTWDWFTHAADS